MKDVAELVGITLLGLLACLVMAAGAGLILAFPVKLTWNAIMPYLFSLPTITWGKAWCLIFLSHCLIKSSIISKK